MIIPQAPIEPPVNVNIVEEEVAAQALSGDLKQTIKEIFLRHLINGTIKQNERANVRTDVLITDLATGRAIVSNGADETHFAASINKLPVALLVLEDLRNGTLQLDQTMTWQESDKRAGYGIFDQPGAPLQASLQDVIFDLLNKSGNTATRVLVNGALGGPEAVNARFETKSQLSHTALIPVGVGLFYLGDSAPSDSLWSLSQIVRQSDEFSEVMKQALATNIFTDFGVRSAYKETSDLKLVNKIGLLDDVEGDNRHDVGVIHNQQADKSYGYAIFTTSPFDDEAATPRAERSLKMMGHYMLHFAGGQQRSDSAQDMQQHAPAPDAQHAETRMVY